LKLYYCPSCARVYYLSEYFEYICGRIHVASVWPDGKLRKCIISEKTPTDRPPWPIPRLTEERELLNQEVIEMYLAACENPDDENLGDIRRHFGYGAPGGKHLTRDQVVSRYEQFVLLPAPG